MFYNEIVDLTCKVLSYIIMKAELSEEAKKDFGDALGSLQNIKKYL